jgi:uncharacterized protein YjbI with pentapeptide repeats
MSCLCPSHPAVNGRQSAAWLSILSVCLLPAACLLTKELHTLQDANLSDVLMDRATMNEANLRNAILERAVFTRYGLM